MQRFAMIGFGAIGRAVLETVRTEPSLKLAQLIVSPGKVRQVEAELLALGLSELPLITESLVLDGSAPVDCVVECAGHSAIQAHVLPALQEGLPCILVSIGALSEPGLPEALEMAATQGNAQLHLLAGAIGGIDALAAARFAGLDEVVYTGRKPPTGWLGSPAEEQLDLRQLNEAAVFFDGTAREAARQYPKNANVAATLSLAGLGLDHTRVRLIADPGVTENIHHYQARGAFGRMEVTMVGQPLASNPRTSALTVYSVVRALYNRVRPIAV